MKRLCIVLVSLVNLPASVACRDDFKPASPRTGQIPLNVWVVVGVGESVGNTSNRGCRLTANQIRDRIHHLQNHTYIFGSNIIFQWSPENVLQIEDPALLPFQPRTRDPVEWHAAVAASNWDSKHLNIYFVGNVQETGADALAYTIDPASAQQLEPSNGVIILNDGGFTMASGFDPDYTPAQMTSFNVIEHEMVHFLIRRFNEPPYDGGEHVPDGANNILVAGGAGPGDPYPLVVPGRWNQGSTEQKEIWDRVFPGLWNNP